MAEKSLFAQFKERSQGRRGPRCTMGLAIEAMNEKDREDTLAALAEPGILGTAISRVLKAHGFDVGADTVNRHRRRVCSCES